MTKEKQRFVVPSPIPGINCGKGLSMLVISDVKFWQANEIEIRTWVNASLKKVSPAWEQWGNKSWQTGMVLVFADEEDRMLFLMRWS